MKVCQNFVYSLFFNLGNYLKSEGLCYDGVCRVPKILLLAIILGKHEVCKAKWHYYTIKRIVVMLLCLAGQKLKKSSFPVLNYYLMFPMILETPYICSFLKEFVIDICYKKF